jgi:hypothetical protein
MGLVQRLGFLFTKPATTIPPGMDRTLENVKRLAEAEVSAAVGPGRSKSLGARPTDELARLLSLTVGLEISYKRTIDS